VEKNEGIENFWVAILNPDMMQDPNSVLADYLSESALPRRVLREHAQASVQCRAALAHLLAA
jgi:hypothetical protein